MSIVHWFDGHHCSIHWKGPLFEELLIIAVATCSTKLMITQVISFPGIAVSSWPIRLL